MTIITKNNGKRQLPFDEPRLRRFIEGVTRDYPKGERQYPLKAKEFSDKIVRLVSAQDEQSAEQITQTIINNAVSEIDMSYHEWTHVASEVYMKSLYKKASVSRTYSADKKYGDFYALIQALTNMGIYSKLILESYSKEEIDELGKIIDPEKDKLFTYIGAFTLADRYLATDGDKNVYELPQERWLIIAMTLMAKEPMEAGLRTQKVKELYWALSNLYMTVATPTLANAGKAGGQLSSCFIDTVDDDLHSIYDSNSSVAQVSKYGGGVGVYMGKIRSRGSSIRGIKGVSSGVLPWIKQLNNTAVSVDQLGQRQGAITVYLDVFHDDIELFLDLKLNNGDERMRAHDIFTGVCVPDLFMEKVESRGDWYLFDPHEVRQVMGFSLEDYYDEEKGAGSFRRKYEECVQCNELNKRKVPAIDLMKRILRSQFETGTPFMFYRDEVNRKNPNSHEGMIYSSNLCTEITQNQSPTKLVSQELKDGLIVKVQKPGDFVVCNLSSINLGRAVTDNVLERVIKIQVRALDNVIELNNIPVLQADYTNQRYRAIGLGTFGWHHLLAKMGIEWDSDVSVEFADELYETIAFLTIRESMRLAEEKGAYPLFEGSDWHTGEYFEKRGYFEEGVRMPWKELSEEVKKNGLRNGYLMAVAPNMSTSIIAGSTASIDPIFNAEYTEEKSNYRIKVTAPEINQDNFQLYKSAYHVDPMKSIEQNARRQRHIDQGISFNFYIQNSTKAAEVLQMHMEAWKSGFKTSYYLRSSTSEIEECEWCHS